MSKQHINFSILTLIYILTVFICTAFAQAPEILWKRNFGGTESDEGNAVQQTSDNGFIIFGANESSGLGGVDMWLIKTDSLGNPEWTKTIGFNELERGYDGLETFNGDFVITGYTNSVGAGSYDVLLARTSSKGDTLWTRTYGTSGYESGNAILQTPNGGGFVIAGETGTTVAGEHDVYLVKTNSSGNLLWTQTIGGPEDDVAYDVRLNSNDEFLITGYTKSYGAGDYDVWLICTDASGNTLWNKTFGGEQGDFGQALVPTSDGGCAITGWTYSFGAGFTDALLIRTDAYGNTLWTKTFGQSSAYEVGSGIAKTGDGGFIISGTTIDASSLVQNVLIIRTDSLGNVLWSKTIPSGGSSSAYCIRKTSNDGYIISGAVIPSNRTDSDVLLIRLDSEVVTTIDEETLNPISGFELFQNYPNPFNPTTTIKYQIPELNLVSIKVFDILGNEIKTLVDGEMSPGKYEVSFDASVLSSGIYFYRLQAGKYVDIKNMLLLK